jgi:hypothetical protein
MSVIRTIWKYMDAFTDWLASHAGERLKHRTPVGRAVVHLWSIQPLDVKRMNLGRWFMWNAGIRVTKNGTYEDRILHEFDNARALYLIELWLASQFEHYVGRPTNDLPEGRYLYLKNDYMGDDVHCDHRDILIEKDTGEIYSRVGERRPMSIQWGPWTLTLPK